MQLTPRALLVLLSAIAGAMGALACTSFSGSDAAGPGADGAAPQDAAASGGDDGSVTVAGGEGGSSTPDGGCAEATSTHACDSFDRDGGSIAPFWNNKGVMLDTGNAHSGNTNVFAAADNKGAFSLLGVGGLGGPDGLYTIDFQLRTGGVSAECSIFRVVANSTTVGELTISSSQLSLSQQGTNSAPIPTSGGTPMTWTAVHLEYKFGVSASIKGTFGTVTIPTSSGNSPLPNGPVTLELGAISSSGDSCGVYLDDIDIHAK